MADKELVAAIALYDRRPLRITGWPGANEIIPWPNLYPHQKQPYLDDAHAAIEAIEAMSGHSDD